MSLRTLYTITLFLLLSLFVLGENSMAIEQTKYTVIEKEGDFEVRQYEPHIVAETFVEGDFDEVGNEGFRRLAGYIFGENRKKHKISMTAPVTLEVSSENIAMTAPVNQEPKDGTWRITFFMPSKYTLEMLPEPLDSRVVLKEVPGALMAALTYSGFWSRERYEQKKVYLETLIQRRGLQPSGEPIFARYDPPFKPWFLRRNEVLIPVEQIKH
jgi:hypothetical protein